MSVRCVVSWLPKLVSVLRSGSAHRQYGYERAGRDLHYQPGAIAKSTRYTALNVPPARLRQSVTLSQLALAPVRATVSGADLAPRMFCPACTL